MRHLFVDTSAYFALTDIRDENHEAAIHIIHQLISEQVELLTTNYIIAETHTLVDAISFATMERFHVTQAFAFDHHFVQYGFSLLPAIRSRG